MSSENSIEYTPQSPFANGPRANDAAEKGATPTDGPGTSQTPGASDGISGSGPTAVVRAIPLGRELPLRAATSTPSVPGTPSEPLTSANPDAGNGSDESAYADTFYGQVGGHETFKTIIHVFYQGIAADPLLRAMYHEEDLGPAEHRMLMFIEQYWGGPRTYLEERGHPRLRMRHVPFQITPEARDRWLAAMRKGVDAVDLSPLHEATLWDYMERAAASLVNAAGPA